MTKKRETIHNLTIREYQASDYEEVKKNLLEKQDMFDPVWDSEESLNREIERDSNFILVAEVDGKVVGNVFLKNWWGYGSWIFHLAVKQGYKGKGIAARLMDEAEDRLRRKGAREIALFVDVNNAEAREFYAKSGYHDFPGEYKSVVKKLYRTTPKVEYSNLSRLSRGEALRDGERNSGTPREFG
ncbi:GNAT family N-acetyltransferase [Patescibacteria group bacterium]|nr:GNAT family N-acetyltransferase [Patescibacteria group bacterium]